MRCTKKKNTPFSPCGKGSVRFDNKSLCINYACFRAEFLRTIFYLIFWRCLAIGTNNNQKEHLINEEILASFNASKQIRVVSDDGEQFGLISLSSALETAEAKGLDLVLIAPQSEPPVAKIMNYGKFKFDRDKKKKEAKKNQVKVDIKEVQLSCNIDVNDFNTKVNNARRFLTGGNKVKVRVIFHGRQMAHQDIGKELLARFEQAVADLGSAEKKPILEGRALMMFIAPLKASASGNNKSQSNN